MTTLALGIQCDSMAQAQMGGMPLWTNLYNGPGNGGDFAAAVAVDINGNVFVTGHSTGSDGDYDYATIKYSGAGVPLWTNHYNGPEYYSDSAYAVAVDGSGNVFVTGESFNSSSSFDYATIKYSGAGVPLWTNRYNAPVNGADVAVALAVDANGNVFVTGYSSASGGGNDYATIKYSGAGVPLWTNYYNGTGNGTDGASALVLDTNGNVFVTGVSGGNGSLADYATIKYSNAGVPLWTNRYNGPGNGDDWANAIAVDTNGNVFVTGYQFGSGSDYDYATIKYSNAGVPLWTNRYNGPGNSTDFANAIALDPSGNVFVTGFAKFSGIFSDYATIKYSGAGVPLWTNRYNGPANNTDQATAITLDTSGHVFVTGFSMSSSNTYNYATIAYSGTGVPLWTNRANGSGNNPLFANASLAADRSGHVFMTGYSLGLDSGYDYMIVKYSIARPSLAVARTTTNTVALSWPSPSTGFTLQQNTNGIATVNWSNVLTTPTDNGTTKTVIVNPPAGNRFFRLKSQ
jgi:hypothetical protein